MKVFDWRPEWEKHFLRRWESSEATPRSFPLASTLGKVWNRMVERWIARRVSQRHPALAGPKVVSVGNLALGGTGKTPLIMALAGDLAGQGLKGAVLTRGYRSPLAGPIAVTPDLEMAGDEARLMAGVLGPLGWTVAQARQRHEGLDFLQTTCPDLDFILLEDGHQTRQVGRHLDIVILDRWEIEQESQGSTTLKPLTGPVFPFGPYRESAEGTSRAGILVVESDASVPVRAVGGQPVATFTREGKLRQVSGSPGGGLSTELGALAGIARHGAFEQKISRWAGREPRLAIRMRDHQEYGPRLADRIIRTLDAEGVEALVTTAKDWIKLKHFWPRQRPAFVVELEIKWGTPHVLPQLVREHVGR